MPKKKLWFERISQFFGGSFLFADCLPGAFRLCPICFHDWGVCCQERSVIFLHFEPKMEHLERGPFVESSFALAAFSV